MTWGRGFGRAPNHDFGPGGVVARPIEGQGPFAALTKLAIPFYFAGSSIYSLQHGIIDMRSSKGFLMNKRIIQRAAILIGALAASALGPSTSATARTVSRGAVP